MDINQIRMLNYRSLLLQFQNREDQKGLPNHGLLKRFAEHCGVSARYLSHINSGRKNIGDAVARQFETGLSLPHGWMDNHHEADIESTTDAEKKFMTTMLELFRDSPVEAQNMLTDYLMNRIKRERKPAN